MADTVAASLGPPAGPEEWFLIFDPECDTAWVRRWVRQKYLHVSAIGWLEWAQAWVIYDVSLGSTKIEVWPASDPKLVPLFDRIEEKCVTVLVRPRGERGGYGWRWGFWCVPAMKHLLGIRCGALLPDGLLRHLLAEGCPVIGGRDGVGGIFGTAAASVVDPAADGSAERGGRGERSAGVDDAGWSGARS